MKEWKNVDVAKRWKVRNVYDCPSSVRIRCIHCYMFTCWIIEGH